MHAVSPTINTAAVKTMQCPNFPRAGRRFYDAHLVVVLAEMLQYGSHQRLTDSLLIIGIYYMGLKAALHSQRFERAGAATKIDSFGSDRKRPRWELNLFLLTKRPKIGRLRSD